jgi:general secretion pathway protein E
MTPAEELQSILLEQGVQESDLDKAKAYQLKYGGRLEQIAINMGSLSADCLPQVYSRLLGLAVASPAVLKNWDPPENVDALPLEFLISHGWLPLTIDSDGGVCFATKSPLDFEVNRWLGAFEKSYVVTLVSEEAFAALKARLGRFDSGFEIGALNSVEEGRLRELAAEAPTVNLLNALLTRAIRQGASDLHFEPQTGPARVRFRIDGVLHEVDTVPTAMVLPIVTRLKILAGMDIGERRRPQDGKIEFRVGGEDIDIRASMLPASAGESVVLRFLRKSALVYDMKELGLSSDVEKLVMEDLAVTSGVVLLTGPTGSGKTTTLYTFLSRLNRPQVKIVTLEDPIEYQIPGINQVQVQPAIGFDFAHGLRSIVRQDPDIIMVGEIRDRETASIAMQSALTGHLVFSTVHTNDSPSAFTRLLDLGVEEFLLNAALRSIIGQRLARKLCVSCRKPSDASSRLIDELNIGELASRSGVSKPQLWEAVGCDDCGHTGYRGRVAIAEYFRCDDTVKALPKGPDFLLAARRYSHGQGWRTLTEDGFVKALTGTTTVAEVLRVAG